MCAGGRGVKGELLVDVGAPVSLVEVAVCFVVAVGLVEVAVDLSII